MSSEGNAEKESPAEIRAEIEQTRAELGETVAAVAEKTDVKAHAQAKVSDVKEQASANGKPVAIAAAVVGLFVLWRLVRR